MKPQTYQPHPAVHRESLWWLTVSPAVWIVHFLVTYATVGLWCAKFGTHRDAMSMATPRGADALLKLDAPLGGARVLVIAWTLTALFAIALNAWRSFRRHRLDETSALPHDFDTRESRTRFLGFASFLLSLLSAVAVIYVGLPALFIETCR